MCFQVKLNYLVLKLLHQKKSEKQLTCSVLSARSLKLSQSTLLGAGLDAGELIEDFLHHAQHQLLRALS